MIGWYEEPLKGIHNTFQGSMGLFRTSNATFRLNMNPPYVLCFEKPSLDLLNPALQVDCHSIIIIQA